MSQIDEPTLEAVRKLIDSECSAQKMFFDECDREGQHGSDVQKIYQSNFNTLVILREKITAENLNFNGAAYVTYAPVTERIFIQNAS